MPLQLLGGPVDPPRAGPEAAAVGERHHLRRGAQHRGRGAGGGLGGPGIAVRRALRGAVGHRRGANEKRQELRKGAMGGR